MLTLLTTFAYINIVTNSLTLLRYLECNCGMISRAVWYHCPNSNAQNLALMQTMQDTVSGPCQHRVSQEYTYDDCLPVFSTVAAIQHSSNVI